MKDVQSAVHMKVNVWGVRVGTAKAEKPADIVRVAFKSLRPYFNIKGSCELKLITSRIICGCVWHPPPSYWCSRALLGVTTEPLAGACAFSFSAACLASILLSSGAQSSSGQSVECGARS